MFLIFFGCTPQKTFEDAFYENSPGEWKAYLNDIGIEGGDLSNTVLIFANTTACRPCLDEIAYWDLVNDDIGAKVSLILVEGYKANYTSFLNRMNVRLPAYQDSASLVFEKELIPYSPIKIYFDHSETVQMIYPVGADGRRAQFLNRIGEQNSHNPQ
ncbi:MAG: hypothetical protein GVY02_06260 [Bacteroidetes bacterium]|nr:hypothetical protein [Bacteroidota bacterium]